MLRIAICDDEVPEIERAHKVIQEYAQKHTGCDIEVRTFLTPWELLRDITDQGGVDVLLLDVYMKGMLGTDLARELRQKKDEVRIIFITSSKEHSLDAFEVDADQYLVKPYTDEKLSLALDKVLKILRRDRREVVTLKTSEGITRLWPREVVFTETGRNNYQIIHTIKRGSYEVRMTSIELFELLSQNKYFIQCGASLNINLKYVRQISKKVILFDNGKSASYPYRAYGKLKEAFLQL